MAAVIARPEVEVAGIRSQQREPLVIVVDDRTNRLLNSQQRRRRQARHHRSVSLLPTPARGGDSSASGPAQPRNSGQSPASFTEADDLNADRPDTLRREERLVIVLHVAHQQDHLVQVAPRDVVVAAVMRAVVKLKRHPDGAADCVCGFRERPAVLHVERVHGGKHCSVASALLGAARQLAV
jgi:hypothetical protein